MSGGGAGQRDGHHVAPVAGDAVRLELGDQTRVLGVLEQLPHLLVLLRVHLHVVLREATFAVPADFSAVKKEKQHSGLSSSQTEVSPDIKSCSATPGTYISVLTLNFEHP